MKLDKFLVAVTISIFLLAGSWIFLESYYNTLGMALALPGIGVAGFLGWATFYAAGSGKEGLKKGIPANMSGIFWGIAIVFLWDKVFAFNLLGSFLAVGFGAGMMCFQAHFKPFGFIPGAFIGCSTFFALGASITMNTILPSALGLLCGLLLGYVSEQFAIVIKTKALNG